MALVTVDPENVEVARSTASRMLVGQRNIEGYKFVVSFNCRFREYQRGTPVQLHYTSDLLLY
jgi:hypothetical protein